MRPKKLALSVAVILFIAIVTVSAYIILSVRHVTFEYTAVSSATEEEMRLVGESLSEYAGKSIFFVGKNKIRSELERNPYFKDVSVRIKLPSTISVTLCERRESFAVKKDDGYFVVAEDLTVLCKNEVNASRADGLPLPVIDGDVNIPAVVEKISEGDPLLSSAVKILSAFPDGRNELGSVTVSKKSEAGYEWNRIIVKTKEGASFTKTMADKQSEEKIALLLEIYSGATGGDRTGGKFVVFSTAEGGVAFDTEGE
ncbi:MAG: FtsQ-type POTRA domain-containing protein [Clostridia bacterium]|nr:FtsQ-type POTRA domain-containing protein [Clostridia bacterium]